LYNGADEVAGRQTDAAAAAAAGLQSDDTRCDNNYIAAHHKIADANQRPDIDVPVAPSGVHVRRPSLRAARDTYIFLTL